MLAVERTGRVELLRLGEVRQRAIRFVQNRRVRLIQEPGTAVYEVVSHAGSIIQAAIDASFVRGFRWVAGISAVLALLSAGTAAWMIDPRRVEESSTEES